MKIYPLMIINIYINKMSRRRPPEGPKKPRRSQANDEDDTVPTLPKDIPIPPPEFHRIGRHERYQDRKEWLSSVPPSAICNLSFSIGNPPKQFSEGMVGTSFGMGDGIAVKVVKKNKRSEEEIKWYLYFTDYILKKKGFPHFPLIYHVSECQNVILHQTFGQKTLSTPIQPNPFGNFVICSELADGNMKDILIKNTLTPKQIMGMITQVVMACLELEEKEIIHNDLEPGNILYHSYPEKKPIEYMIDATTMIRLPDQDRLWVLWDFGMMVSNGEEDPRRDNNKMIDTLTNDLKMTFFTILSRFYSINTNFPKFRALMEVIDSGGIKNVRELVGEMARMGWFEMIEMIEIE